MEKRRLAVCGQENWGDQCTGNTRFVPWGDKQSAMLFENTSEQCIFSSGDFIFGFETGELFLTLRQRIFDFLLRKRVLQFQ